jgi:hypothetical protein
VSDDERTLPEHRLHWLVDAVNRRPRHRGHRFWAEERVVRALLRRASTALARREITASEAVLGLLLGVTCALADVERAAGAIARCASDRSGSRSERDADVIEPPPCALRLPRGVRLDDTPPGLLRLTPLPRRARRRSARHVRAPRAPKAVVDLNLSLKCEGAC